MEEHAPTGLIEVPHDRLSPEALRGLVDEFVTREGTDYGQVACSLETKRDQVLAQIRRGEVAIVFDLATESCTLALSRDLREAHAQ